MLFSIFCVFLVIGILWFSMWVDTLKRNHRKGDHDSFAEKLSEADEEEFYRASKP